MKPGQMCKIYRIGPSALRQTSNNHGKVRILAVHSCSKVPGSSKVILSRQHLAFCTHTLRLRHVPKPQTRPPKKNSKKGASNSCLPLSNHALTFRFQISSSTVNRAYPSYPPELFDTRRPWRHVGISCIPRGSLQIPPA